MVSFLSSPFSTSEVGATNAPELWQAAFPWPRSDGHKHTRGRALIAGGAVMTGAARLAARAALRMGAGLVTVASPPEAFTVYATALESVMVRPCATLAAWKALIEDSRASALLIGPGLGQGDETEGRVCAALASGRPCVVDADALTAFAAIPEVLLAALNPACVLTPHEGEFARLFGKGLALQAPKAERALRAAQQAGCVVVLKGSPTLIATPEGWLTATTNGPPDLATAGSGDVLAGMILGLLASGMPVFEAANAAVWLHGEVACAFGPGLIAEDLVAGIPAALQALKEGAWS